MWQCEGERAEVDGIIRGAIEVIQREGSGEVYEVNSAARTGVSTCVRGVAGNVDSERERARGRLLCRAI